MTAGAAQDAAYRSVVLDQVFGLLQPIATWPGDADSSQPRDSHQAYRWAHEARDYGDLQYSTTLSLALAEAAAVALEEDWDDTFDSFYGASLATGAPPAVLGRIARRMFAGSWYAKLTVLYALAELDRDDALEIGRAALRLDDDLLEEAAARNLIRLFSETDRLEGRGDCCEVLDTSPDPPSPFVRATHFLLATGVPGESHEALAVHLPELDPDDSAYTDRQHAYLTELAADLTEHRVNLRYDTSNVLAVAARRWTASSTPAPLWVRTALGEEVSTIRWDIFGDWSDLVPWSSEYWSALEEHASVWDTDGGESLAYAALEVLADNRFADADERALAADFLGLLVDQSPELALEMMLAEGLLAVVGDEGTDLSVDGTLGMSVARALGYFTWMLDSDRAAILRALEVLTTSRNEHVRNQAQKSLIRLTTSVDQATHAPIERQPNPPVVIDFGWAHVLKLYPWQRDALQSWVDADHRGVIEAVTGAGKTRVALAAIADALSNGYQVAVLVPSVELLRQWRREIEQQLLDHAGLTFSVGQMGAGRFETLASCDVLLATLSSASRYQLEPPATGALLVVDEVHRAGAPTWAAALEPGFNQRLGLTATYEREDLGIEEHLDPYFGGVCASVGYGEALRDGVIAPFKVAHVGVRFTPSEQDEYDRYAKQAAERRRQLIDDWGCPAEPFGEFLRAVHRLSASGIPEGSRVAGFYLSAFSKRRAVLSNASGKFRRLQDLTGAVHAAEKTIVFTQTKQAAADAVAALADGQIAGAVLHAGMDLDARAQVFGGFEDGTHELVAAPRLLDEGVDVPAADLGIVIAASRSRRQMIQRMGRILRRKTDGRPARFVIMFVEGSSEDPQQPGHEGFLELITPYALDVQRFDGTATPSAINSYLNPRAAVDTDSVESKGPSSGRETGDEWLQSMVNVFEEIDCRAERTGDIAAALSEVSSIGEHAVQAMRGEWDFDEVLRRAMLRARSESREEDGRSDP